MPMFTPYEYEYMILRTNALLLTVGAHQNTRTRIRARTSSGTRSEKRETLRESLRTPFLANRVVQSLFSNRQRTAVQHF